MNLLFLDFETRSAVDLKKCGAEVYARHPSTEVLCIGYAFDDEPSEVWNGELIPPSFSNYFFEGAKIVAHNAPFELTIWNNVCVPKYGWPELKPEQTICTMAMAYAMSLPGSLEKAAAAVGLEDQKDMVGHRTMLQISKPKDFTPDGEPIWWDDADKLQKLYAYCKQDVEVERKLFHRLVQLSQSEKEIWLLDYEINQRGVRVDVRLVEKCLEVVSFETQRLNKKISEVTQGQVPTTQSVAALTAWVKSRGVEVDSVAAADVVELLDLETLPNDVREALLCRQEGSKSSTAKLQKMIDFVADDGRVRGMFQYHGAGTGRWAGRNIQFQNLPRPKLKQEEIEEVFELLNRERNL